MSYETGSPPFSQIVQHPNKTPFLFYQPPPQECGFCSSRQVNPLLSLFCNKLRNQSHALKHIRSLTSLLKITISSSFHPQILNNPSQQILKNLPPMPPLPPWPHLLLLPLCSLCLSHTDPALGLPPLAEMLFLQTSVPLSIPVFKCHLLTEVYPNDPTENCSPHLCPWLLIPFPAPFLINTIVYSFIMSTLDCLSLPIRR